MANLGRRGPWHVYQLMYPNGQAFYIGVTSNIWRRYRDHHFDSASPAHEIVNYLQDFGTPAGIGIIKTFFDNGRDALAYEAMIVDFMRPSLVNRRDAAHNEFLRAA